MKNLLLTLVMTLAFTSAHAGIRGLEADVQKETTWECDGGLITATHDSKGMGAVVAMGKTSDALVQKNDLETRWDFLKMASDNGRFSIVIDHQGKGDYYDFTGQKENVVVQPVLSFDCEVG